MAVRAGRCLSWTDVIKLTKLWFCDMLFFSVWSTEVRGWQNKLYVCLGRWVTVFSPNDISGLRRPENIKFVTKVASSTRMMHALRLFEKKIYCGTIFKKMPKICQKCQFSKNTRTVVPSICRNSIYAAPPCEWILPWTVQSTEDPQMIVNYMERLFSKMSCSV